MPNHPDLDRLEKLAKLIRYFILISTTEAGSGHPTSSLSAVELMVTLLFGGFFRFDADDPSYPNNDRLIFSKGHASPLLYALWAAAGKVSEEELLTLRKFGSRLEGHPAVIFPYTEAATGSLGQGLSIGVGMALNAKYVDNFPYRTYVLLGDSEMSEGSQWEALQLAAHYKLDDLVAILDVNRLGQRGETMYGHDLEAYRKRIGAFGWRTIVLDDGHSLSVIVDAYQQALESDSKPTMIIAKTIKGKGVSLLENKNSWHGKALQKEELVEALAELGPFNKDIRGAISRPAEAKPKQQVEKSAGAISYPADKLVATRKAYGNALVRIYPAFPQMVVLDAEVSNSTFSEIFKNAYPERFFEMFIAEQNMAGVALGLSRRGKIPFASTFAAFWTRALDQIRMSQYSQANIKFIGSHAGVSIGEDGPSQMGLEDIAIFRALLGSVVLYPADAIAAEKLVEEAAKHNGIVYLRTTRKDTPILYSANEAFAIGGSKVLKESSSDAVTVVAAGITLFEALKAYEELKKDGVAIRVIDLYSIKPLDEATLKKAAAETQAIIVAEDHFAEGGMGEAVASALASSGGKIYSLAVLRIPKSGTPDEQLDYEEISHRAIALRIKELIA